MSHRTQTENIQAVRQFNLHVNNKSNKKNETRKTPKKRSNSTTRTRTHGGVRANEKIRN